MREFPRAFWVINGIELFERGAYYSLAAVFTVFMRASFQANGMGLAEATSLAGLIGAVLFLLLYIIPVLTAPLSERLGYKRALGLVFILLTAGYGLAAYASRGLVLTSEGFRVVGDVSGNTALVFIVVGLLGLGAGIFKPIAAALVAQTSTEKQRNFAFSIYYACINLGALVFPLSVGLAAIAFSGRGASIAFTTAAVLSALNLALALFVFRNVREPQRDVNLLTGVKRLGEIFRYPSFLVLMAIYSGFWFMYAMSLTVITLYLTDFSRMPLWFNVLLQQSINPAVIILVTPLIGGFTQRHSSLVLMIIGILVYSAGLVALGFSGVWWLFIGGIVIFSVGELLTHPSYLSYVSKLAPPGKESLFLGYGFIPIGVGLFFGSSLGADLYSDYALTQGRPEVFWGIMASVGIVTSAALLVYNLVMKPRAAKDVAPGPAETTRRRSSAMGAALAVGLLFLIPAVLGGAALLENGRDGDAGGVRPLATTDLGTLALAPLEGTTKAKETTWADVTFPENATGEATLVLTWKDEAATGPGSSNQPDKLRLHVQLPDGTHEVSDAVANPAGGEGRVELKIPASAGVVKIGVEVVEAGATTTGPGLIGLPMGVGSTPDAGNAWNVAIDVQTVA